MEMTLREISKAAGGRLIGNDITVFGVSTDSRSINPGELFIPIKGENFDGHDFVRAAVENGAASFISDREIDTGVPYVLVKDTRQALMDLAAYYRSLFDIPVIAVTGSVGKTSVKNGVAAVLGQRYNVLKTEGNFNNEIGLPLTVFKLNRDHQAAVFEMGMNGFGEISNLSKIVKPDIGIITNIGSAHIEKLGSREGILKAKLEIIDGMNENGTLILNYDNDLLKKYDGGLTQKILWVSARDAVGVHAKKIISTMEEEFGLQICYGGRTVAAELQSMEEPHILNALMAATAGILLGLSDNEISEGVMAETAEKGRLELRRTKSGGTVINDYYNANVDSMKLALDVLSRYNMEKIAILGDMFELGDYAKQFHQEIGKYAHEKGIDFLIAIGDDARYYKEAFDAAAGDYANSRYYETKREFFDDYIDFEDEKAILVKASRGMKFEDIFDHINGCVE